VPPATYAQRVLPPPSEELLAQIYGEIRQVRGYRRRDTQDERHAEEALRLIVEELARLNLSEITPPATPAHARALIAAADEWISLASSICCRVYAPASPMPKRLLMWSRKVAELLRMICSMLEQAIGTAARLLGASSWTVAASFPWGVSLGLNFDTSANYPAREAVADNNAVEDLRQQLVETQRALSEAQDRIRQLSPIILSKEVLDAIKTVNRPQNDS
jgi:hypothetical protein